MRTARVRPRAALLPEDRRTIAHDRAPADTEERAGGSGFLRFRRTSGSMLCHAQLRGESELRAIARAGGPFTALAATATATELRAVLPARR